MNHVVSSCAVTVTRTPDNHVYLRGHCPEDHACLSAWPCDPAELEAGLVGVCPIFRIEAKQALPRAHTGV